MKKKVNFVIEVPNGKYCWDGSESCEHFDNEGGHSSCGLGFWEQKDTREGVLKAPECIELKEI